MEVPGGPISGLPRCRGRSAEKGWGCSGVDGMKENMSKHVGNDSGAPCGRRALRNTYTSTHISIMEVVLILPMLRTNSNDKNNDAEHARSLYIYMTRRDTYAHICKSTHICLHIFHHGEYSIELPLERPRWTESVNTRGKLKLD